MHPLDGSGEPRTQPRAFMRHASSGAVVPPSTAIRSRFRALGAHATPSMEQATPSMEQTRGTKRQYLGTNGSPLGSGVAWTLETPTRDTMTSRRRLFAASPARDTMDLERARFELHQVELERERDREAALRVRLDLEAQLAESIRRADKIDRDRRWLADQDARRAEARKAADEDAAKREAERVAETEALREQCSQLEKAADDAARRMRAMMADHRREVETLRAQAELEKVSFSGPEPVCGPELPVELKPAPPMTIDADRVAQLERDVAEQCAYTRAAEAQNRGLRADVKRLAAQAAQADTHREAAHALRAKVARLEAQLADHADRSAALQQLQQERAVWAQVFDASPVAAAKAADTQRRTIATLEAQASELQARLDDVTARLADADKTTKTQTAQIDALRSEKDVATAEASDAEARLQRMVCETDFLRAQLASYDAEDAQLMASYDQPKADRIRQLEMFVDQQRTWMRAQSTDQITVPDLEPLLAEPRAEAERARTELAQLAGRCEALEKDAARMELQLGAGLGFNPRTTRILQLRDNPASRDYAIRSERLDSLAAENAALVDAMRALGPASSKDSDETSPLFSTIDNLRRDNDALSTQLRESAKLMARYKQMWKRQSARLRDAVYNVLGFRVDFLANGHMRCTSKYTRNIDHNFVFSEDPQNPSQIRLIGGTNKPYLQGLNNDMRFWIQERGSIPGFMATVTLQNFETRPADGGADIPLPPIED
ncbi:coiled-coil domain-containing protein mad1 [Coemansia sp. BCRC 34301]|nr:coiled-coil domain-containing protein mad1 [Coemansia sp. BCRC 34301]